MTQRVRKKEVIPTDFSYTDKDEFEEEPPEEEDYSEFSTVEDEEEEVVETSYEEDIFHE